MWIEPLRNSLREGDWSELPTLEPVNGRGVNSYSFLCTDIRTILEVSMLAFLLCFKIEPRETTEVLLDNCLIDSRTAPDTLTVVVSNPD